MLNSRRSHGLPFNDEQIDDEKRCWRGVVIAIRNTQLSDWMQLVGIIGGGRCRMF